MGPFCSRGFGVGFGYLNTEPDRVFGALGGLYKSLNLADRSPAGSFDGLGFVGQFLVISSSDGWVRFYWPRVAFFNLFSNRKT